MVLAKRGLQGPAALDATLQEAMRAVPPDQFRTCLSRVKAYANDHKCETHATLASFVTRLRLVACKLHGRP